MVIITGILLAAYAYVLSLLLTRFMGRKLISQMTFFDFVVAVSIGSITANLALGGAKTTLEITSALVMFALLTIFTDVLHIKSYRVRKLVTSEPVVLIGQGKIIEPNLGKTRLSIEELMSLLREKDVFNIADVAYAIFETDGHLSVLKKAEKMPVTPQDLNIAVPAGGLTKELIIDGTVMEENMKAVQKDRRWLDNQLKSHNISDPADVFFAGLDSAGKLYISKKEELQEEPGQYGIE